MQKGSGVFDAVRGDETGTELVFADDAITNGGRGNGDGSSFRGCGRAVDELCLRQIGAAGAAGLGWRMRV